MAARSALRLIRLIQLKWGCCGSRPMPEELTLFIYVDDESGWVPAAPPVSLDGINTTITGIEGE